MINNFIIEDEILKNKINEIKDKIDIRSESLKYEIDIQKHNLFEKCNKFKVTNFDEKTKKFAYYQSLLRSQVQFLNENKRKLKNKVFHVIHQVQVFFLIF